VTHFGKACTSPLYTLVTVLPKISRFVRSLGSFGVSSAIAGVACASTITMDKISAGTAVRHMTIVLFTYLPFDFCPFFFNSFYPVFLSVSL
jgi:hypothetical protein